MKLSEQLEQLAALTKPAAKPPAKPAAQASGDVADVLATVGGLPAVGEGVRETADELSALHQKAKEIEDQIKDAKERLMNEVEAGNLAVGDTIETSAGHPAVSVRKTGRTFDPIKAATVLPPAVIESISVKQIDPKVAKAKLPPELYALCQKDGRVSLVLR